MITKERAINKQKGQGTVEYVIVTLMLVAALLAPLPGENENAISKLTKVIKQHYKAYKYAHSVGVLPLNF